MSLRISEIFGPTVQGEGALIGAPTVFVRAGGCDYRCTWCDTMHAVDSAYRGDWTPMTPAEAWAKVKHLSDNTPLTVSLSGGNPAIQNFEPLIALGHADGYTFACETQGSVPATWFARLDTLVLSPKPPSSGMRVDWTAFEACLTHAPDHTVLKIVVFDEVDYAWARGVADSHPSLPLYLQPGNDSTDPETPVDLNQLAERMRWLVDKATADRWFAPHILPQLHVFLWGNARGV